jgi:hypothetical protein
LAKKAQNLLPFTYGKKPENEGIKMALNWSKIIELNNTARELAKDLEMHSELATMFMERWSIERAEITFSELQKVWQQLEEEYKKVETN